MARIDRWKGTSMYKNVKVILIGGSPLSGKTTLSTILATSYGYSHISTDDIGEILQTALDIDPMNGLDYKEYYIKKSPEELETEAYEYHKKIFPAIERLIGIHSCWSNPLIMEGWALYPEMLKQIKGENVKKIWLVCEPEVLQKRLVRNKPFYSDSTDKDAMISKYLGRSIWHNDKIWNECKATKDPYIYVTDGMDIKELLKKSLFLLDMDGKAET